MARTIALCRPCHGLQDTTVVYRREGGLLVETTWTCDSCGAVLYHGGFDPNAPKLEVQLALKPRSNRQMSLF